MKHNTKRITALALALAACLSCSITVLAQNDINDVYTVQKDDTLWKISRKYMIDLDDVIHANPQLDNPDLIYPGDKIAVPMADRHNGKARIGASMADAGDGSVTINPNIKEDSKVGLQSENGSHSFEAQVAELVNQERAKQGLSPLKLSADISNVARIKSEDMRNSNYFDHNSPTYGSPFDMLRQFGINYKTAGENIAKGQKTPQAVMTAWMNSEGHRKNIMSPSYKEIGVGYVTSSNGTTYWTQQFVTR